MAKDILDVSLSELHKFYLGLIERDFSTRKKLYLQSSLHLYSYLKNRNSDFQQHNLITSSLPDIAEGDVVQIINGNSNTNISSNSHIRCLLSYALQFRLQDKRVHLIIVNLPSLGNTRFWGNTIRYSYKNYILNFIEDQVSFNPYSSISVLLDHTFTSFSLREYLQFLSTAFEQRLSPASLYMGLSGGGPNFLGSHGLEWAEGLLPSRSNVIKSTLMCHMYDSPLFLQDHTLLSMSARPTQLAHTNMSLKHPEYKKNQRILQASMINPVLFSNTRLNDFKFDQSELEFLDLIENLGPTVPILFMAGPWLDAKIKSGFNHPETNQKITTSMAIIPILEHFNYKISVFCVGASKNSLLPHLGQLPEPNLFCLHNSDNFTPLLSKISDLNVNIVATFPPNAGNGSTNSQVAHSGLPAVFLYPNDSEAMAPEFFFAKSIKEYHATIFKLFHSSDFRQSYMYKSQTELTRRTSQCLAHISELLNS